MVRIGLIGLGFMGRMHLAAYEKIDGAKLVAVADKDEKRAAGDLSGGWGNVDGAAESIDMTDVTGTTDFKELIENPDVDLVDICVPTPFHEELAITALKAGKHVLCEKPLALDSASAGRIAAVAEKSEGVFMPAMCMRFWPQWAWLKDAVESDTYGKVLAATFRRCASMPPGWFSNGEMSGGAILDLHIHDTDFVYYLFGKPNAVRSQGYSKTSGKTDHVTTQFIYGDHPKIVTAEGSWCMADEFAFTMRYTVNFENATADFDITRDNPLIVYHRRQAKNIELEGDGYNNELKYLVDCINNGNPPRVVTGADAVASIQLVEAEQKSIDTGEAVSV